jgi:hypothetical protein
MVDVFSLTVAPVATLYGGETVDASRRLDKCDKADAIERPPVAEAELVISRSGTLTSVPARVSTMYVCASSSK